MSGWQPRPAGSAPRLTTAETTDSLDLFVKYTTLEDRPSPHEQAASVDTEMLDCGEDTIMAPTATAEPANNTMSVAAETTPLPRSSQAERSINCSLASPSQTSSNWSLSPVLDSMYTWSASSPPPTRYLQFVKQLDSLYGGCSAN